MVNRVLMICLSLGAFGVFASGCEQRATSVPGEVAAKVNNDSIGVAQVEYELFLAAKQKQGLDTENLGPVALEQLINQELLAQQAVEQKLDNNPAVQIALLRAKKRLLAQAYLEKLYASLPNPQEAEIKQYFDENKTLFSERRVFKMQQIVFAPTAKPDMIKSKLDSSKSAAQFEQWLNSSSISNNSRMMTVPSEKLPMGLLPQLSQIKDGQGIFVQAQGKNMVFWRHSSELAPVTLEQASPFIVRFLVKKARENTIQEEIKRLRGSARIDYQGKFTKAAIVVPVEQPLPSAEPASDSANNVEMK